MNMKSYEMKFLELIEAWKIKSRNKTKFSGQQMVIIHISFIQMHNSYEIKLLTQNYIFKCELHLNAHNHQLENLSKW